MAAVRSRGNKDTEQKLAAILRAAGITGWRRHQGLPGRPDFAFRAARLGTVFCRVRYGKSMAEPRTDGTAGYLRVPRGGSGCQITEPN